MGKPTLRYDQSVVRLLDRAVIRILDNLTCEGGPTATGVLRVGEILRPGEAGTEGQIRAIPLLRGKLQRVICIVPAIVGIDHLVETLIRPASRCERRGAGKRQVEVAPVN